MSHSTGRYVKSVREIFGILAFFSNYFCSRSSFLQFEPFWVYAVWKRKITSVYKISLKEAGCFSIYLKRWSFLVFLNACYIYMLLKHDK